MINRLINMEIPPIVINKQPAINTGNYTIRDYAVTFLNGMSETQRSRFRKMLENGINCRIKCCRKLWN